jgi:hypothetical protein
MKPTAARRKHADYDEIERVRGGNYRTYRPQPGDHTARYAEWIAEDLAVDGVGTQFGIRTVNDKPEFAEATKQVVADAAAEFGLRLMFEEEGELRSNGGFYIYGMVMARVILPRPPAATPAEESTVQTETPAAAGTTNPAAGWYTPADVFAAFAALPDNIRALVDESELDKQHADDVREAEREKARPLTVEESRLRRGNVLNGMLLEAITEPAQLAAARPFFAIAHDTALDAHCQRQGYASREEIPSDVLDAALGLLEHMETVASLVGNGKVSAWANNVHWNSAYGYIWRRRHYGAKSVEDLTSCSCDACAEELQLRGLDAQGKKLAVN